MRKESELDNSDLTVDKFDSYLDEVEFLPCIQEKCLNVPKESTGSSMRELGTSGVSEMFKMR